VTRARGDGNSAKYRKNIHDLDAKDTKQDDEKDKPHHGGTRNITENDVENGKYRAHPYASVSIRGDSLARIIHKIFSLGKPG
jgi:hypothetical protein